jgi:hypothetical protein
MDKKIMYENILLSFLQTESKKDIEGIDFQVIKDVENNHYQLVETGWYAKRFIHAVLFHFQIKPNGKVWILANNTEELVAEELVKKGIAASDIVLSFVPEKVRQHTGYAVA